jgi:hypothetical protein
MKTTAFRAIYLVVIFSLLIAACSEEQLDKTKPPALPHDHNQHQHSDTDLLNINPEAKKTRDCIISDGRYGGGMEYSYSR